ncbi:MAG TPA: pilus assembly protein TadG-related protein [Marmoricola sp.]|nr:pilus assembly protein TadG-related protein [Marmoricola sp.]
MTPAAQRDDVGAGSVLALLVVMVLTFVGVIGVGVGGLLIAHRQAQAAADLAALAGASALQWGDSGCVAAARIAARNRAGLTGCVISDQTIAVTVEVSLAGEGVFNWHLPARARAGPVEAGPG